LEFGIVGFGIVGMSDCHARAAARSISGAIHDAREVDIWLRSPFVYTPTVSSLMAEPYAIADVHDVTSPRSRFLTRP